MPTQHAPRSWQASIKSIHRLPRFSGGQGHRLGRLEAPGGRRSRASAARSSQERKTGRAKQRKSSLSERAQGWPLSLSCNVGGLRVALTEPAVVAALVVGVWLLRGRVRRPGVRPTKVGELRRDFAGSASSCSTRSAAGQAGNKARVAGAGGRRRAGRRAVLAASSAAAATAAGPASATRSPPTLRPIGLAT